MTWCTFTVMWNEWHCLAKDLSPFSPPLFGHWQCVYIYLYIYICRERERIRYLIQNKFSHQESLETTYRAVNCWHLFIRTSWSDDRFFHKALYFFICFAWQVAQHISCMEGRHCVTQKHCLALADVSRMCLKMLLCSLVDRLVISV